MSLTLKDKRFCYQGNASNNKTFNGDKFILKHMHEYPGKECHQNNGKQDPSESYEVDTGDLIKVEIHGGGCSNKHSACVFTEVQFNIDEVTL